MLINGFLFGVGATLDLVGALKLVAIVTSGFFGLLGLVTEFRNKETEKITRWGILSLVGVVLSSSVAFAIQYAESTEAEKTKQKAADETLRIVKNTEGTLSEIQRLLNPIDEPTLSFGFRLNCASESLQKFCRAARQNREDPDKDKSTWRSWPGKGRFMPGVFADVTVFQKAEAADAFQAGKVNFGEEPLNMTLYSPPGGEGVDIATDGEDVYLFLKGKPKVRGDGSVVSMRDFRRAIIFVHQAGGSSDMEPTEFGLDTRRGMSVATGRDQGKFRPVNIGRETYYRYDFSDKRG